MNGNTGKWNLRQTSSLGEQNISGWVLFEPEWIEHEDALTVVRMGGNDLTYGTVGSHGNVPDHIVAATRTLVESLPLANQNLLLLGLVPHLHDSAEIPIVQGINARINEMYPDCYVDVLWYMQNRAAQDVGIELTSEDLALIEQGFPPASLYEPGETTHPSKEFHTALSGYLAGIIRDRGLVLPTT